MKSVDRKYRLEIQGLRAFSVIAVIINHLNTKFLPSGYLGVDIFFVISGYVITSSLSSKEKNNFWEFISSFYERRIKRLLPALIFFTLVCGLLICCFVAVGRKSLITGITGLFGVSNLYLLNSSTDYFANATELNVFAHTWSLGVEEQFYLFFPFIFWFAGSWKKRNSSSRGLFNLLVLLSSLSVCIYIYLYEINQSAAYFLMPTRFWEIALGSIVYLGAENRYFNNKVFEKFPPIIILVFVVGIFFYPNNYSIFTTLLIVLLTSLLLLTLKKGTLSFNLLTNKKIVYIGNISYSLYLWHWGIISISRWTIGVNWWSLPMQLGLIYGLSVFSYELIEKPFSKRLFDISKLKLFLVTLFSLISSSIFLILINYGYFNFIYLGNKKRIYNYSENKYWQMEKCGLRGNLKYTSNNRNLEKAKESYQKCWFRKSNQLDTNQNIKRKKVFFYGNSYIEQLMPVPALINNNTDFNAFIVYYCNGMRNFSNREKDSYCLNNFNQYLNFFKNHSQRGDLFVFTTGSIFPSKSLSLYINELINLSKDLRAEGKRLVLISRIPFLINDPDICSSSYSKTNQRCKMGVLFDKDHNSKLKLIENEIKKIRENDIIYIDIYEKLINTFSGDNKKIYDFYKNKEHLSRKGAFLLTDYLKQNLGIK